MSWALPWIHSDARLLAVHEPAGLLVHLTALDAQAETGVMNRLRSHGVAPLWPLHRLDKGT